MEDCIIKETMNTMKDDVTGEIWYHIIFTMTKKNGDGKIELEAEAEATAEVDTPEAHKAAKKECRVAGRFAFIHALEKFWNIPKT